MPPFFFGGHSESAARKIRKIDIELPLFYNLIMLTTVAITIPPENAQNDALIRSLIESELKKSGIVYNKIHTALEKKSVDARHGRVKIYLRFKIFLDDDAENAERGKVAGSAQILPERKEAGSAHSVVIVGAGPAGLFGALKLLESGIRPVIIERGADTAQRKKDIALISTRGIVSADSNYCFGEGGAGTFSDGKLYTRSNKRGDISQILRILVHFGASEKILTDAHPHIGTDRLPKVINNMRRRIEELGGEIHFNTKCTDLIVEDGRVIGVKTLNTADNTTGEFRADAVLLATGHSAPDIYMMIARHAPQSLEAKTFAAGVRVEHPREMIDRIQYHKNTGRNKKGDYHAGDVKSSADDSGGLGAAEYRLTAQIDGRGVYSFCMCPGGFVVPSASGADEIVVNGMSAAKRNSKWSNSAIVVEISPEDIPQKHISLAESQGCAALAGLFFRSDIEHSAKNHGEAQKAPAQRLTDFLANRISADFPPTSYTPGIIPSNLNDWLEPHICTRLRKAFPQFNQLMHGFVCDDAVIIAPETRTSTPVRILRNKETFESVSLKNLYPAGEGSGYAGGIVSSAMDGENCCKAITRFLLQNRF